MRRIVGDEVDQVGNIEKVGKGGSEMAGAEKRDRALFSPHLFQQCADLSLARFVAGGVVGEQSGLRLRGGTDPDRTWRAGLAGELHQRILEREGIDLRADRLKAAERRQRRKGFRRQIERMLLPYHAVILETQAGRAVGNLDHDDPARFDERGDPLDEGAQILGVLHDVPDDENVGLAAPGCNPGHALRRRHDLYGLDVGSRIGNVEVIGQ